jgi:hypothetical protein
MGVEQTQFVVHRQRVIECAMGTLTVYALEGRLSHGHLYIKKIKKRGGTITCSSHGSEKAS